MWTKAVDQQIDLCDLFIHLCRWIDDNTLQYGTQRCESLLRHDRGMNQEQHDNQWIFNDEFVSNSELRTPADNGELIEHKLGNTKLMESNESIYETDKLFLFLSITN